LSRTHRPETQVPRKQKKETTMKVMGLLKADADSEAGLPPTPELVGKMGDFIEEITRAGVLLQTDGIQPSSTGKRVNLKDGKYTVIDGPFTETKELVAGYAIFQVDTMEEAVEWTKKFLNVLGTGQCELRPVFDMSDFPAESIPPEEAARDQRTRQQMERNAQQAR
jgi:hypothetical protein